MHKLHGPVGKNALNMRPDVSLVQTLLNAKMPRPFTPLRVDGSCGVKTMAAIVGYQRAALKVQSPDGIIVPDGPTWKSLLGQSQPAGASALQAHQSAKELLKESSIRAMLEVLAYSEGTGDAYGTVVHGTVVAPAGSPYLGKRNVVVTDFADHPNLTVQVNAGLRSTAAGRYQFLHKTWVALGMSDFSPASQDEAAVKLLQRRHMVAPLLAGDFGTAVQRGSLEWASLPDATRGGQSHYGGQPARTLAQLQAKYLAAYTGFSRDKATRVA